MIIFADNPFLRKAFLRIPVVSSVAKHSTLERNEMLLRRSKNIFRKSIDAKMTSVVIAKPHDLKILLISFLILSTLGPFASFTTRNPSSRYIPSVTLSKNIFQFLQQE